MDNEDREFTLDLNEDINLGHENETILKDMEHGTSKVKKDGTHIIGKTFKSEIEAYQFYNAYARTVGFSICKHWASRSKANKKILGRTYICSCEGEREKHARGTPVKSRAVSRTSCMARLQIKLENENYTIVEFIKEHNHKPTPQDKVHLLRSQRKIQPAQAGLINSMQSAGITSVGIFFFTEYRS